MAKAYALPEQLEEERRGTSAPIAEVAKVHGLIPGVGDIPYITGMFPMESKEVRQGETLVGRIPEEERKGALFRAVSTFSEPTPDERRHIAAGGGIQVLDFNCQTPIMAVTAVWHGPPAFQRGDAVIVAAARAAYEAGRPFGSPRWDDLDATTKQTWQGKMKVAADILHYWMKDNS